MTNSDDFSTGLLGAGWRLEGPAAATLGFGSNASDHYLTLATPDGNYDAWQVNTAARVMQDTGDTDFQLETRFLSTPTQRYQNQGFLVEQDAQNWVRFDTYSDGGTLYAFGAITVNGSTSAAFQVAIAGNSAPYLQLTRSGDSWLFRHSGDGTTWTTAGSFSHALEVSAAGLFTGNSDSASGYTALVDYFEVSGDPLLAEDGGLVPPNRAPDAAGDAFTLAPDTGLTFSAADLLANDSDPDGDALSVSALAAPANGTLVANGDGSWTYTPTAGFSGTDSLAYTVTDGSLTDTATISIEVAGPSEPVDPTDPTDPGDPGVLASDDFSTGLLGGGWRLEGPAAATLGFGSNASDHYLTLATPDGNYDAWQVNTAARVMQDTGDTDFQLETRFLSTPTQRYQNQGFLVEQDAQNWVRFDTYSDGGTLYAFGAITVNGSTSAAFQVAIAGNSAPYLQLTRSGDSWLFRHSGDGTTWTTAGSFSHALEVSAAGLFTGNSDSASGYTALVDYFEVSGDPLLAEDGGLVPPNRAPDAAGDAFTLAPDTGLTFSAADLLANDSDPDGDALSVSALAAPANGTLVANGDGSWTYTPTAGFSGTDSLAYTVTDGSLTDTATISIEVAGPSEPVDPTDPTDPGDPGVLASDDFSTGLLGGGWRLEGPAAATLGFGSNASDHYLTLATPDGNYDAWQVNTAARVMQDTGDTDFQLETRFLSTPTQRYQNQGFLVEQDAQNWVRFDTYSDGGTLYAFGAITVNGSTSAAFQVAIAGNSAPYLQLTRSGDSWLFRHSGDGTTWTTAGSFSHALEVSAAGLFTGNSDSASGYTALVDYFEVSGDPLLAEDGGLVPPNRAPDAAGDAFTLAPDTGLTFSAADLLANDSDPDGDALSVSALAAPANGTLVANGDGSWTYTPTAGFSGTDSLAYTVTDGSLTDTATISIEVAGPSEPVDPTDPTDPGDPGVLASDDFSTGLLGGGWRLEGPAAATLGFGSNASDHYLTLATPDGNYDAWQVNTAARVMQDTGDTDFQLETRFLSTPTQRYQNQGFLVEQDAQNWVRFDTYSDGGTLYAFGAITVNGSTSAAFQVAIAGNSAPYLQLTRSGDSWLFRHSGDGTTWTTAGSFSHALEVSAAGLFTGNSDSASGYTALVDYFEVSGDPLLAEDGGLVPPNRAPDAAGDAFTLAPDTGLTFSAADLLANDSDPDGDALSVSALAAPANGTLVANGDGSWTYTPTAGFSGTDSLAYTVTDGSLTDTATVAMIVGNPIDVWYGAEQTFGDPGELQVWINILGKAYGDITSLSYSLNGGPAQGLSIGSDGRRLQELGDFNVEIAYSMLDGSAADDVVRITAVTSSGDIFDRDVTIKYESGNTWNPNYGIDWSGVTRIPDVVQVVDGTWEIGADGVRPVDLGYDRLLTLGDRNWDNYELTMQITPHDLLNQDASGRDGGGFAIGMLWNGHTDDPIPNVQPHAGWEPGAAFFFSDTDGDGNAQLNLHPTVNFFQTLGSQSVSMQEDATYNVVLRVEQVGLYDRQYSIRIWEDGTPEPVGWSVQGTQNFAITQAPTTGGIYLNAHYNDISFGDLTVTEITGDDILQGTGGDDLMVGVDTGAARPGRGEIDVFVGGAGADTFVFGDASGAWYDDGDDSTAGMDDYGFVWDFASGTDTVRLWGSAQDYVLGENAAGLPSGTAIWLVNGSGPNELVASLNDVYGLDLGSGDFSYVDQGLFA